MSEAAFLVPPARVRRPRLGYLMAGSAAVLWGINGGVSKTILATGLSSERLAQVRSLGAALGEKERHAQGVNQSTIHTDFMIGSNELAVDGLDAEGTATPILRNGDWVLS